MEFIPGSSLRPLIQQRKLSPADAVAVMRQVVAGLAHAHANGVIHRDVKPENILIHERAFRDGFAVEGVVKVTDFGLGRAAASTAGSIAYSASMNNPEGRDIAGTLDYMSPEARSGGEVDGRVDIYACGVVLYEMLTGERPAGTDVPSDLNPTTPRYLDEIFRRSYARLDKRYATADELAKALQFTGPPPIPATSLGGVGRAFDGRPPHPPMVALHQRAKCPQCQQPVQPTDQFCMHCGMQLVEKVRRCQKCGAYPDPSDAYCMFCGETLMPVRASMT